MSRFQPSLVRRVRLYTKDTPLYEQFGLQEEMKIMLLFVGTFVYLLPLVVEGRTREALPSTLRLSPVDCDHVQRVACASR